MRILAAALGAALLVAPGTSASPVTHAAPAAAPVVAPQVNPTAHSASGTVVLGIPPVVFTAEDGWPTTLRRGRAVRGELRFAAGPGTTVTDVVVAAPGGSIDCPPGDRTTTDFVTTLDCRLRPASRPDAARSPSVLVTLTVTTTTGTTSQSYAHDVTG